MSVIRFLLFAMLTLAGWSYSATVYAEPSCSGWNDGSGVNFGTVTPGQSASTTSRFTVDCVNSNNDTSAYYVRTCSTLSTATAPLQMNANGVSGYPLYFNFYPSDNSDTPLSANSPVYAQLDLFVPGAVNYSGGTVTGIVTLIGRILSGQTKLMPYDYYQYNSVSYTTKYAFATSAAQLPSCSAIPATHTFSLGYNGIISASVKNGCAIAQVENMNFGQLSPVNSPRLTGSATSSVTVSCPVNTTFSVALGDGLHNQQSVRNMCNSSNSDCIPYQLYQDAAHTQQWNTTNTQTVNIGNDTTKTLTVYGFVPSQDWPSAGDYSDTVTVTLSY